MKLDNFTNLIEVLKKKYPIGYIINSYDYSISNRVSISKRCGV